MRKLLPLLLLAFFLTLAWPVSAQEATPAVESTEAVEAESAPADPTGLSTLVLLLGLGAVSVVGLAVVARDNFQERPDEA